MTDKHNGPFDAAIKALGVPIVELEHEWEVAQPQGLKAKQEYDALIEQFESAIRVLEDYPRWAKLIEAAQVGREPTLSIFKLMCEQADVDEDDPVIRNMRALFEAIPVDEEENNV
jgi:hypothetical protein